MGSCSASCLFIFMFMRFLFLLSSFYPMMLADSASTSSTSSSMQQQPLLCHDSESSALLQFKQSFLIDKKASVYPSAYPKVATWNSHEEQGEGRDCCSWDGVECDKETGHVIGLHLASSCLYGSINSSSTLFDLVHLRRLDLSDNNFIYSEIPTAVSQLSRLQSLNLSLASFSGQIPSQFSNLAKLSYLDLSYNRFSGQISSFLGNLTQVSYLDISFNSFEGRIPSFMANLTALTFLSLSENNLSAGTLSWLGQQTKLTKLHLMGLNLYGEIPSGLVNMSELTILDLAWNQLSGHIPSWFMNLTQLTELYLQGNNLEGSIPSSLFELVNIQFLYLNSNKLNGTLEPHLLSKLKNLTQLQLSENRLSFLGHTSTNVTIPKLKVLTLDSCGLTKFPDFLQNLYELELLSLSYNKIQGPVPKWMLNVSRETLMILDLSENLLTAFDQNQGVLPWSRLHILKLDSNKLQGSPPIPPPSTLIYQVSRNELTGEIPQLICKMTSLMLLDLSANNLSGRIPSCLTNFSKSLQVLNLGRNSFDGPIPQTCMGPNNFKVIDFGENKFQGQMPRSLANCSMLEHLILENNQIDDTFPFWLGALPQLQVLILRGNRFHGSIGSWHTNFRFVTLRIIDLSNNEFSGDFPSVHLQNWDAMKLEDADGLSYMEANPMFLVPGYTWVFPYEYSMTMTNKGMQRFYEKIPDIFRAIDFSGNNFGGHIPTSIGNLKGLHLLNLADNNLTGHIPSSLGDIAQLESLDLSQNKLSGGIPWQLTRITFLAFFNVSYNHLNGSIPQGNQFTTFPDSSFVGNPGLCGSPLLSACGSSDSEALPKTPSPSSSKQGSETEVDWKFVCMGYASGVVVGVSIGYLLTSWKHDLFVETFGKRQSKSTSKESEQVAHSTSFSLFSFLVMQLFYM